MSKEALWSKQNKALRHPSEIFGTSFEQAGITKQALEYNADPAFIKMLHDEKITLIASREYENMLISLTATSKKTIEQRFFHLPHPSGIAIDRDKNTMYVAATRNPNQVVEFKVTEDYLSRLKVPKPIKSNVLLPARSKYYPGEYYFHDLALSNGKLYANSVGMNCVIEVNMSSPVPEKPLWWPKCIEVDGKPNTKANFIQLNSIAIGKNIKDSFFSASGSRISSRRPGHLNYPVDKQGVIFSAKTGEPIGFGLTRPHSARMHDGKIWVANSGYGEAGYIDNGEYRPVFKFDGWTRGLCFMGNIMFVGVSRILPKFRHYAPGITSIKQVCAIVAVDLLKQKVIGEVRFPYGNQIFAIDFLSSEKCSGLPFKSLQASSAEKKIFSVSLV
ncbi:MAG: DUF4915 domain-containing protein [Bacteroidota bacterium]